MSGGTPPYQYAWSNGGQGPVIDSLAPGPYTLTVTDQFGCLATDSARVYPIFVVDLDLETEDALCGGPNGKATVFPSGGTPPYQYHWDDPDQQTTQMATGLLPGTYLVTVTDSLGCLADTIARIEPLGLVDADFSWETDTCLGDSILVQFTDESTGDIASWSWTFGDPGRTSNEPNPSAWIREDSTLVTLVIVSTLGCRDSIQYWVDLCFLEAYTPDQITACLGDPATITATDVNECDTLAYFWYPPDSLVSGQGTGTVGVTTQYQGSYWVFVDILNQAGCMLTDSTRVDIVEPGNCCDPVSYRQCDSLTIDFAATGDFLGSYYWDFGDPRNPDDTSRLQYPVYTYPDTGTYTVTLIPLAPCLDTQYLEVTVEEAPYADFDFQYDPCTDTARITFTDRSQTPDSIFSWIWSFGNGDSAFVQDPVLILDSAQVLDVRLTILFGDSCVQQVRKTLDILVFDPMIAPADTLCMGLPDTLNAGGDPHFNYLWTPGSVLNDSALVSPIALLDSTTTFRVIVSDSLCSDTFFHTVYVPPMVILSISGDTLVCTDEPVMLTGTSRPDSVFLEWSEDPDFLDIFARGDTVIVFPGRPSTFYLRGTDAYGCEKTDSIVVGNYSTDIRILGPEYYCLGDTVQLTASATTDYPDDLFSFTWVPIDSVDFEVPSSTVNLYVNQPQTLLVFAENQFGCTDVDSVTVDPIDLNAEVNATADPVNLMMGEQSQLQATDRDAFVFMWIPPETLDDPGVSNPIASPEQTTTYVVMVTDTVTGCRAKDSVRVFIDCCQYPQVFIPDAFSPNGDGVNDELRVLGLDIEEMHLMIFNRWGEKVFESFDQKDGWDGTFRGRDLPPDVYGYHLVVRCVCSDTENTLQGNVTLFR